MICNELDYDIIIFKTYISCILYIYVCILYEDILLLIILVILIILIILLGLGIYLILNTYYIQFFNEKIRIYILVYQKFILNIN